MAEHGHEFDPVESRESARLGVWLFLATETLLFGTLFTAYTIFRIKFPDLFYAEHLKLDRTLGAFNTVVLIASSLTVALATAAIKKGKQETTVILLTLTILLACVFLGVKFYEYNQEFAHGNYPSTNLFFSLYFMMTGLHGLHIVGGIIVIGWALALTHAGRFGPEYDTPVEMAGLYWHFVDLVWIYLFPLLYLVG